MAETQCCAVYGYATGHSNPCTNIQTHTYTLHNFARFTAVLLLLLVLIIRFRLPLFVVGIYYILALMSVWVRICQCILDDCDAILHLMFLQRKKNRINERWTRNFGFSERENSKSAVYSTSCYLNVYYLLIQSYLGRFFFATATEYVQRLIEALAKHTQTRRLAKCGKSL